MRRVAGWPASTIEPRPVARTPAYDEGAPTDKVVYQCQSAGAQLAVWAAYYVPITATHTTAPAAGSPSWNAAGALLVRVTGG